MSFWVGKRREVLGLHEDCGRYQCADSIIPSIDRLDLLRKLFTLVLVPRAVAEEYGEPLPGWIKVLDVKNKQLVQALLEYLHRGEAML